MILFLQKKKNYHIIFTKNVFLSRRFIWDGQQQQQSPSADSTMSERSLVPFALVNLLSTLNNIDVNTFLTLNVVSVFFLTVFSIFFFAS